MMGMRGETAGQRLFPPLFFERGRKMGGKRRNIRRIKKWK
ncbi:hypothetical protein BRO54_0980 [Geobacillus proteiniphilus]|uniref:Uncharacterized protein n=1 Tax=Geobacillus proteiniphilus TaxID=860353 RepID=A0A1Q5T536_9BACL|nr:hypothetical protein I656_01930 [Geobacillus sp. WSUCF1]OKO95339.1 hypothetical protein BRO54_0980 [Geobacillus proteiniphilus]